MDTETLNTYEELINYKPKDWQNLNDSEKKKLLLEVKQIRYKVWDLYKSLESEEISLMKIPYEKRTEEDKKRLEELMEKTDALAKKHEKLQKTMEEIAKSIDKTNIKNIVYPEYENYIPDAIILNETKTYGLIKTEWIIPEILYVMNWDAISVKNSKKQLLRDLQEKSAFLAKEYKYWFDAQLVAELLYGLKKLNFIADLVAICYNEQKSIIIFQSEPNTLLVAPKDENGY